MSISTDSEIIKRIKEFLGIDYDIMPSDLYEKLYQYRYKIHPDLFIDKDEKSDAEKRFKDCYNYLEELSDFLNKERMINPKNLTVYDQDNELFLRRQEIIENEKELEKYRNKVQYLESSNSDLSNKVKSLENELKTLRTNKISEKSDELISTYKPTSKNIKALGITIILSTLIVVLTQIEQVTGTIFKYSPVEKSILNYIVFTVFIFVMVLYLKKFIEHKRVEEFTKIIQSQKSINGFYEYLMDSEKDKEFSDYDVYQYIELKLEPQKSISKHIFSKIIKVNKEETYEVLKEIFIYNLLIKGLVVHVGADNLNQMFKIKKSTSYTYNSYNFGLEI